MFESIFWRSSYKERVQRKSYLSARLTPSKKVRQRKRSSRYKENLTYQQDLTSSKKVRHRKIIWLNSPYSVNVETNIGKTFLKLIDKHCPKTNKFHKIFNRNNVKVSYSFLPNFANIIKSHNNRTCLKRKPKINLNIIANRKIPVL